MKESFLIIIIVAALIGLGVAIEKNNVLPPTICTDDAMVCPDGSAVGRVGPNCEFAECPSIKPWITLPCKKDSDCPSSKYICQEIMGAGTACPSGDGSCIPTHTIIQGECKLKANNRCSIDTDCAAGNLCHKKTCLSPVGRQCSGLSDKSCPVDFECVQGCGPPVARENDPPPPYFCQLKGYSRPCPICLAKDTLIDTPLGRLPVQDIKKGMPIWTQNLLGKRVEGVVTKISKTPVPHTHKMIELRFDDGRTLLASPGHPTIYGENVEDLIPGMLYDGALVISSNRVSYSEGYTYDFLPSGETGFYFANGIVLDSTLHTRAVTKF